MRKLQKTAEILSSFSYLILLLFTGNLVPRKRGLTGLKQLNTSHDFQFDWSNPGERRKEGGRWQYINPCCVSFGFTRSVTMSKLNQTCRTWHKCESSFLRPGNIPGFEFTFLSIQNWQSSPVINIFKLFNLKRKSNSFAFWQVIIKESAIIFQF